MPRYFFHYRCGREVYRDEQGIEFVDIEAAYDSAFTGAIDMWSELLRERIDPRTCAFSVTDAEGRALFTLPFNDVLHACRRDPVLSRFAGRGFLSVVEANKKARQHFRELHNEVQVTARVLRESRALIAIADQMLEGCPPVHLLKDEAPVRDVRAVSVVRALPSPAAPRRVLQ